MTEKFQKFCLLCFASGAVLPWSFLAIGGALGLFGTSEAAAQASAYLVVAGLVIMVLAYLFVRAVRLANERMAG